MPAIPQDKKQAKRRGVRVAVVLSYGFFSLCGVGRNACFRFLKPVFPEARGFQILKPAMSGWLHIPFVLCNQSLGPRGNQRKHCMRCEGDFNGT